MSERCIRQFVLIVAKNAQFHSNQIQAGQFTAEIAIQKEDPQDEDIRLS